MKKSVRPPDRLVVSVDDDGIVRVQNTGPRALVVYLAANVRIRLRCCGLFALHPRTAQEIADGVEKPWGLS